MSAPVNRGRWPLSVALVTAAALIGCDRDQGAAVSNVAPATAPATAPAAAGGASGAPAAPSGSSETSTPDAAASAPAGTAVAAATAAGLHSVEPAADLQGRLGRLVVAFPEGTKTNSRVDVFKSGDPKAAKSDYGDFRTELLPGRYDVAVSNKRIGPVEVRAKHETRMRVGTLRVKAEANTRIDVLDADKQTVLAGDYGSMVVGLPAGEYHIRIAGQTEPVKVEEGKATDF